MIAAGRFNHITDPMVMNLLKLTERDEVISFSGGTPAPQTFPINLIKQAVAETEINLQYSPAQGTGQFRQSVADWLGGRWGYKLTPEHILITTGSQQALDLVGRTFVNPGDPIAIEDPTYFVALYAFGAYDPKYKIANLKSKSAGKLLYIIPNFHNPLGTSLDLKTRQFLAGQKVLIIEDDPYRELYFQSLPLPPIFTLAPKKTIYITSTSKILGPALRLGLVVADPEIIRQLTLVKTGMDLCTSGWLQTIAGHVLQNPDFETRLDETRQYYRNKCQAMLKALDTHFKGLATWTTPSGGMFIWLTLNSGQNTQDLYQKAIENGVAFVPGYIFRPNRGTSSSLRLSFALATEEQISTGIKKLASILASGTKRR